MHCRTLSDIVSQAGDTNGSGIGFIVTPFILQSCWYYADLEACLPTKAGNADI